MSHLYRIPTDNSEPEQKLESIKPLDAEITAENVHRRY
jgi:hypothetical protein